VKSRMKKVTRYAARHTVSAHSAVRNIEEIVVIPEAGRQGAPQPTLRERLVAAVAEEERRRALGDLPGTSAQEALEAANEELARAREVLEFYATEGNYLFLGAKRDFARIPRMFRDEGRRARGFLRQGTGLDGGMPRGPQDPGGTST
jgi:hypothetical protein